jgi:hypothetical protein
MQPAGLKFADKKCGIGFHKSVPTFAIVLTTTYSRIFEDEDDDQGTINWGTPLSKKFERKSVPAVHGEWKNDRLEEVSALPEDLTDGSVESDFNIFARFCNYQAFGKDGNPVKTFNETFKEVAHLKVSSTPQFCQETQTLDPDAREFLSLRRFLVDTYTDYFNECALEEICRLSPSSALVARCHRPFTSTLLSILCPEGVENMSQRQMCKAAGLPFRAIVKSLPSTLTLSKAESIVNTHDTVRQAKFNVPLREFSSLHNVRVLCDVIFGQSVNSRGYCDSQRMQARLADLARRETRKALHCCSGQHSYHTVGIRARTAEGREVDILLSEGYGFAVANASPGHLKVAQTDLTNFDGVEVQ